jgi:hypothetical protein
MHSVSDDPGFLLSTIFPFVVRTIFTTVGAGGGIFSRHLGELNSVNKKISIERLIEHILLYQMTKQSPSFKFGDW